MKKSVLAGFLAFVMLFSQSMELLAASEDQEVYEYEGTTQISSADFYPEFDTMSVTLTVEEVYIAAGSSVSEGDAVLKLTDDSYQSALDYYQAAILRANDNLTNEELTYTQGMQSAEYELELALAQEEQASFVQEQSEAELTDTIDEHEEVLTEMEERIEALENGEYDTEEEDSEGSSGSSLSGSGSGSSMGGSGDDSGDGRDAETSVEETENGQTEADTEADVNGKGSDQSDQSAPTGGFPGGPDSEAPQTGTSQTGESLTSLQEQIESLRAEISYYEDKIANLCSSETEEDAELESELESEYESELESELEDKEKAVEDAKSVLNKAEDALNEAETGLDTADSNLETANTAVEKANETYNNTLRSIYELAIDGYEDDSVFCGAVNPLFGLLANLDVRISVLTGSSPETEEDDNTEEPAVFSETEVAQTEAPQTEAPQTEAPQTEAPQTEAPQTEAPQTEAPQTEATQPQTQGETKVASASGKDSSTGAASEESQAGETAETAVQEETSAPQTLAEEPETDPDSDSEKLLEKLMELIEDLYKQESNRKGLYTTYNDALDAYSKALDNYSKAYEDYSNALDDYSDAQEKLETAKGEFLAEKLKETLSGYFKEIANLKEQIEGLEGSLYESAQKQILSLEQENASLEEQVEEMSQTADTADLSANAGMAGGGPSGSDENSQGTGLMGQTDLSALAGMSGLTDASGDLDTSALSALSGMSGMSAMSGMSGTSGLSDMASSYSLAGVTQQMAAENLVSGVQGMAGSQDDDSMFGNTYDLSEAWALLERTATDEDEAEELLEELYDMQESVQLAYEELLRREKPLMLDIQYQYDTTVFSARLAEVTYEQTVAQLEEELQSAQDSLSELEEEQLLLENLKDGTVRAAVSGTVSAVNYEADDTLISLLPMYSVYDTDVVTVWITVPQSEIAGLAVGDSVEVSLGGMTTVTGTVTEKAVEAQEGTSRTTVNYDVEISIENTTGLIGSGTSATVTVTVA